MQFMWNYLPRKTVALWELTDYDDVYYAGNILADEVNSSLIPLFES